MRRIYLLMGAIILLWSCASISSELYNKPVNAVAVDYSQLENWAAHPAKRDSADKVPGDTRIAAATNNVVDVFFLHPTTFTGKRAENQWNARIDDDALNTRTDQTTIQFQASIFNEAGRVYAPRYRQAHLYAFYTDHKSSGEAALDFGYRDLKKAFEYYLQNENGGRPIIIAAHSQGTYHAKRLLKEFFDGKVLKEQLIVAYLVGMPVLKGDFNQIPPCQSPEETGCYCSWRTFRENYYPKDQPVGDSIIVTNPLTWRTSEEFASKRINKGAVLRDFDKIYKELVSARVHEGMLWVSRPKFPWSFLFTRKNYHIADYNFFYLDVKENVGYRVETYLGTANLTDDAGAKD